MPIAIELALSLAGDLSFDHTPGGPESAFLQEDGIFGFLLEAGSDYLEMEA